MSEFIESSRVRHQSATNIESSSWKSSVETILELALASGEALVRGISRPIGLKPEGLVRDERRQATSLIIQSLAAQATATIEQVPIGHSSDEVFLGDPISAEESFSTAA